MAHEPFKDPHHPLKVIYVDLEASTPLEDAEVDALVYRLEKALGHSCALVEEAERISRRLNASGEAKLRGTTG